MYTVGRQTGRRHVAWVLFYKELAKRSSAIALFDIISFCIGVYKKAMTPPIMGVVIAS